jgi:hypothetical protein
VLHDTAFTAAVMMTAWANGLYSNQGATMTNAPKRKTEPYLVFVDADPLTDDTIVTILGMKMTAKEVDDILLRDFERNLEKGNEIMRCLKTKID